MPTSRIAIVPLGLTLSLFLMITYVVCVIYGLLGFQQGMHQLLFQIIPGFTWITWPSFFIGLFWNFVWGWYIALVFAPLFNFFSAQMQ
jgi:hypothetical protein